MKLADEIKTVLRKYNWDKHFENMPDHVVVHYARAYLANTTNEDAPWYKELQSAMIDDILLNKDSDPNKPV